jgi:hypothetical protein
MYTDYHSATQQMHREQFLDGSTDIFANIVFKKLRNSQVISPGLGAENISPEYRIYTAKTWTKQAPHWFSPIELGQGPSETEKLSWSHKLAPRCC